MYLPRIFTAHLGILGVKSLEDIEESFIAPGDFGAQDRCVQGLLCCFRAPVGVSVELANGHVANETHSAWRVDLTGIGGKRCTLKWHAIRRWDGSRVVYEHHYDHQQIGRPLTQDDLNLDLGRSDIELRSPSRGPRDCAKRNCHKRPKRTMFGKTFQSTNEEDFTEETDPWETKTLT